MLLKNAWRVTSCHFQMSQNSLPLERDSKEGIRLALNLIWLALVVYLGLELRKRKWI